MGGTRRGKSFSIPKGSSRHRKSIHEQLQAHPNFSFPDKPKRPMTFADIIDFCCETVARYISPSPKVDGENDEFACDDIANAIRNKLRPELKRQLTKEGL